MKKDKEEEEKNEKYQIIYFDKFILLSSLTFKNAWRRAIYKACVTYERSI